MKTEILGNVTLVSLRVDQFRFDCWLMYADDIVMDRLYYEFLFADHVSVNGVLVSEYLARMDSGEVRKTHLFEGRYENIYIDREELASMIKLLPFLVDAAAAVLSRQPDELQCGFWFNDMRPGHVTLRHSHNDDDELLSGVYYLKVPEHSGNLILYQGDEGITITPEEGKLVLFAANNEHEVSRNNSHDMRLSIGMNFGPKR